VTRPPDSLIGRHEERIIPKVRLSSIDVCDVGLRKHHIKALLELDVTDARRAIRERRDRTGQKLSFTAWFVKCAAQAASEHPRVHAVRKGRNRQVVFEDTDFTVLVERAIGAGRAPLPVVIRRANAKSLDEVHAEVRAAQERPLGEGTATLEGEQRWLQRLGLALPAFLRRLFWKRVVRDPMLTKRLMGTIVVTSVGMFGRAQAWVMPISLFPLCFALGTICPKPGVVDGRIEVREYLSLTVMLDHDVVDGAPAARFVARLAELVEGAWGLES
jgi:pyruvate/2-oxoglutarate dehydrogenase complex dihydrolipoamide acyltransferase (E2) component